MTLSEEIKRGSQGGNARKAKLSTERRSEIARDAAQRRWEKQKKEKPLIDQEITKEVDYIAAGIKKQLDNILQENEMKVDADVLVSNPPRTSPVLISGHTINSPFIYNEEMKHPLDHPVAPPQPLKRKTKPIPKAFKGASSYAEKRLAEAIRERAESMGRVAALNAEIPSLVQIIRALGMTPNMNGFQDFTAQIPNTMPAYQQPQYQPPVEHIPTAPNNIDPALFGANSNPLPGLAPALANAPVITNKPLGGAIDLDFVPVDEGEGPGLPKIGGGWQ